MSGAAVVLADGRLAGIVVDAEAGHQQRRLYVVPLAAALTDSEDLSAAVAAVVGAPPVVEARYAPIYRRVLYRQSLHVDGTPLRLGNVTDLGVFGVKPVNFADEPTYLNYVPRDDDDRLTQALRDAAATKHLLLLVGDSGAGKSRSAAVAARRVFGAHRLLRPVEHEFAQLPDIPLAELGPALVWLDDIEKYVHPALGEILGRLLDTGAVVVGTVRRQELQALTVTAEIRNPSGPTLTNEQLVQRLDWKREWSQSERDRTAQHVIQEAAEVYRELAAARPDAFRPYLAMSLNGLSNGLGALGRREEALAAIQEAAEVYRELAAARPDAFRPDLAGSLANLSVDLGEPGRREEALAASQEAVTIRRELAAARPDAFRPDLAMSLNNLAGSLGELGRREEALAAIQEATDIYRELTAMWPDAYRDELEQALRVVALLEHGEGLSDASSQEPKT
jgi:tetratricopeptide (TPR) repeat protein